MLPVFGKELVRSGNIDNIIIVVIVKQRGQRRKKAIPNRGTDARFLINSLLVFNDGSATS